MIARSKCAMRSNLERPPPAPRPHAQTWWFCPRRPPREPGGSRHLRPDPPQTWWFCTAAPQPLPPLRRRLATLLPVSLPHRPRPRRRLPVLLGACGLVLGLAACGGGTATPRASAPAADAPRTFDLEAHRGGAGLTVESTLAAFGHALDLGVTTLELDTQITRDGRAVVTHDPTVDGRKCRDTAPATPGDPAYPYVGKHVNTLRLAQLRTLDCGSRTLPSFPRQKASPGARMPLLSEVFGLARSRSADSVRFNIETKISAGAPSRDRVGGAVRAGAGRRHQDCRGRRPGQHRVVRLGFAHADEEGLARSAAGGADGPEEPRGGPAGGVTVARRHRHRRLRRRRAPGREPFGAAAVSPVHGSPSSSTVDDPSYRPYVTAAMVRNAHRLGIKVIPWTVDDEATMRAMVATASTASSRTTPTGCAGSCRSEDCRCRPGTPLADRRAEPPGSRACAAEPPGLQEGRGQRWVRSRRSATCGEIAGSRPSPIAR